MQTYDIVPETNTRLRGGLSDPARNGLDKASQEAGKLHGLFGEVVDLVKAAATLSGDDLAQAKAKLSEHMVVVRDSMTQLSAELSERALGVARATDTYVRERPWRTLAIGTVSGLVLGLFFARRRR